MSSSRALSSPRGPEGSQATRAGARLGVTRVARACRRRSRPVPSLARASSMWTSKAAFAQPKTRSLFERSGWWPKSSGSSVALGPSMPSPATPLKRLPPRLTGWASGDTSSRALTISMRRWVASLWASMPRQRSSQRRTHHPVRPGRIHPSAWLFSRRRRGASQASTRQRTCRRWLGSCSSASLTRWAARLGLRTHMLAKTSASSPPTPPTHRQACFAGPGSCPGSPSTS
mmetsp:Transcript_59124/g.133874  ORF Transcript_59124/g.133874 Transcript_59124/m.133874 type:complete len:230 (+) Transcript_59124:2760-3449(+)